MTVDLDLRDPASYVTSVDWVRNNVVLRETTRGRVLQLDVALPKGAVSLYMDPENHYIMGFRGADKIYILDDANSERFKHDLESQIKDVEVEILEGLGAGHGSNGLGTFSRHGNGVHGRVFARQDLDSAIILSTFSRGRMTYEQIKLSLSLLVCMISESARIPMMQRDFTNMFYGHKVVADEAIRSYDDAKYLITLGLRIFPKYPSRWAVEKLQKRAAELDSLLQ